MGQSNYGVLQSYYKSIDAQPNPTSSHCTSLFQILEFWFALPVVYITVYCTRDYLWYG